MWRQDRNRTGTTVASRGILSPVNQIVTHSKAGFVTRFGSCKRRATLATNNQEEFERVPWVCPLRTRYYPSNSPS
jgi:hypothetical protein